MCIVLAHFLVVITVGKDFLEPDRVDKLELHEFSLLPISILHCKDLFLNIDKIFFTEIHMHAVDFHNPHSQILYLVQAVLLAFKISVVPRNDLAANLDKSQLITSGKLSEKLSNLLICYL